MALSQRVPLELEAQVMGKKSKDKGVAGGGGGGGGRKLSQMLVSQDK